VGVCHRTIKNYLVSGELLDSKNQYFIGVDKDMSLPQIS
jgi:hypothetical protein